MSLEALRRRAQALLVRRGPQNRQTARPLPGITIVGYARPTALEPWLQSSAMCLFLQGRKESTFAGQSYRLGPGACWLLTHDMAITTRVKEAPSLAVLLDLDASTLRGLHDQVDPGPRGDARAFQVIDAEAHLLDALGRYLALEGTDARVLGPMIAREIHYRLVTSPFGAMLRDLLREDSHASAIARAITRLRRDFRRPISMPELAREVGMSSSLFYQQFRTITASTPLQLQKELRLHEARRLLSAGSTTVAGAAFEVGYESPSQFSREYARKFGVPPSAHLSRRGT